MLLGTRNTASRRKHFNDHSTLAGAMRDFEMAFKVVDARRAERYRRGVRPDHPSFIEHGPLRVLVSASPCDASLPSYISTLHAHNVTHVVRVCEPFYSADELQKAGFEHHDWFFPDGETPPDHVVDSWLKLLDNIFDLRRYSNRYTSTYNPEQTPDNGFAPRPMLPSQSSNGPSAKLSTSTLSSVSSQSSTSSLAVPSQVGVTMPVVTFAPSVVASEAKEVSFSPVTSTDSPKKTVAIHCAAGLGRAPVLVALALVELGLQPTEAVGWLRALRRGAINGVQLAFLHNYIPRPPPSPPKSQRPRSPFNFMSSLRSTRAFRSRSPNTEVQTRVPSGRTSPRDAKRSSNEKRSSSEKRGSYEKRPSAERKGLTQLSSTSHSQYPSYQSLLTSRKV